jgi:sarcosine oxidase subunit gamma
VTARISPLADWAARFAEASTDPVRFSIRELPFVAQIGLRGEGHALGTALPLQANTWTDGPDGQVLWLGPDEWLVVGEDARREELLQIPRAVDTSASRAVIEIQGADARGILAKGCTLDLRSASFHAPQCAQTLLAKAQVLLQAVDDERPAFRLFVRNSFAHYLAEWLLDAAAETRASHRLGASVVRIL